MERTIKGLRRGETIKKVADLLRGEDNVLILAHKSPDGDTLGASFALCRALCALGKAARVVCSDPIPAKYGYLYEGLTQKTQAPEFIVAVDVASEELLGGMASEYAGKVKLCIDHHPSNTGYAEFCAVDPKCAAACELMTEIIGILGVEIDSKIAECLYTGISTDTGCFRFSNTTPKTLRTAAYLIEKGANSARLNKLLFETVSRGRLELERMALENLEYYFDGRAALITITGEMNRKAGVSESETEGIPSIPSRIEGVRAGITVKEKGDGVYKISLRTGEGINASDICARFGGGGHAAAAGCAINGTLDEVKKAITDAVYDELKKEEADCPL